MKIKSMLMGALALVCACAFGEEAKELGAKAGAPGEAARKLQTCDYLLNKDFKKTAKYYLCLFSASWCGPCRAEMPRIAKTYAESLKDDPNVELIHFSRDREEDKALAWAKEHGVKFPVVKYNGGNPLDLHTRGIPHLFIVDADGRLLEEGHPARLFTNEKLHALKAGTFTVPETATEKMRKAIAKLFPGWSLDTEVFDHDYAGIQPFIRGKRNVTFVHPKNRETPSVISRTVKLPGNNPCLSLSVASWNDDADFLLSVRVNGKDALSNRIVCTPDAVPWEDIVVPLSAWRGSTAKIEVVFTANGWWYENPCLARVDIIEADGDMSIKEGKCEIDGYTWSYRAQNGEATIVAENDGRFSAVSPCPVGSITIPATLAGAKVTHIGRDAFLDCSALTSVTIPEGVLRIGRGAFHDCTGLRSIKIPSSVKIIERDAFLGCNALSSVLIPDGVMSIDRGAFRYCCGLRSMEIPSSVTRIGRDSFAYCRGLASVTIPEKVTDIGLAAFNGCNALVSVTIPASVTNIDSAAFCNTGALTSFQVAPGNQFYKSENGLLLTKDGTTLVRGVNGDAAIPPSVTAIGPCAFEGCVALRSTVIPQGVKSIGNYAFKQCRGMKSVTIPPSVTEIGEQAFWGCKGLKSIAIPQGVTVIRNSTFTSSALTEVTIPANVKVLERGAFSWCGELKSVTFPEGMTSIGRDAFYNCGKLTSLTIPASVQRIEQGAFYGCGSLTSVTMRGERPNARNKIFERCGRLRAIHVPANAKSWSGMKKWQGVPLVFDGRDDAVARSPADVNGTYCVIDISGGSNAKHYPVSYLDSVPEGGWGDEYKTTKIVLRRVAAGTYPMLGNRNATFTKPFYIGIFELTQKQIRLLSGDNNRKFVFEGDMRPADCLTWDEMRGKNEEFDYPKTKEVAPDSIIGKLRAKTGLFQIDLPTSYQFGCAWNAGTDGSGRDARSTGRHFSNQRDGKGGYTSKHTIVGSYLPNEWGIYDLHGNVWEMCLDHSGKPTLEDEIDPVGPVEGAKRQSRGGCWNSSDRFVFSDFVPLNIEANGQLGKHGCRIVINVDAERADAPAQKMAVAAKKLQGCNFLLNKDFKKNAKYYLCLFSASWCPPCRAEMPRIAKTYAETLKDDPDIELIHFSRDQNDERALAWAKEHDVKFPVVKPNGGNPLNLQTSGIPHLFIVKADGTFVEEGHPMSLFTEEKLRELKVANGGAEASKAKIEIEDLDLASVKERAENGDTVAMCELGSRYRRGVGVRINNEEARKWIMTAASNGHERAIGLCYDAGYGVSKDLKEAVKWYRKAVDKGDRCAMNNLGICYENGNGVEKDEKEAVKWMRMAADKGLGLAMENLCRYYATGFGVEKDEEEAAKWRDLLIEERLRRRQRETKVAAPVDGYTWSYRVNDGAATIEAVKGGIFSCAVSPMPTGNVKIPTTLDGVKVTSIGSVAFKNCSGLTSVTIPDSVTSIGYGAFENCSGLTSMTIPDSVTNIASGAFSGCRGLTSFIVGAGNPSYKLVSGFLVTKDGKTLVAGINGLTSVAIPNGVTRIAYKAFKGCSGLTSVTIPNSVTSIGSLAFFGCSGLTSVMIPNNVTRIEWSTFCGCSGLTSVTIPDSVTNIGGRAFYGCKGLTSVTIPASVTSIGSDAINGTPFYDNMPDGMVVLGGGVLCGYKGKCPSTVVIPSNVTSIAAGTFSEGSRPRLLSRRGSGLKMVEISSSVTNIGDRAFSYCGELMSVTMCGERPDAPNNIFKGCGKLKSIHVPANAKSWAGMKKWQGIPLVFDGQATVDGYIWSYRVNDGAATIVAEKGGRLSCAVSPMPTGDVKIPATLGGVKVTSIGREAFRNCSGLTSVTIPNSVTAIGRSAFSWCRGLTSVTIPNGVTNIGNWAFHGCGGLTSVTIPDSVTSIGSGAFSGCCGLTSFIVGDDNPSYRFVSGLLVTKDGKTLVAGINGLTSVTIPNGVTNIGNWAFYGCSGLTSVTIPDSVTSIGSGAFSGCCGLTSFIVGADNPSYRFVSGLLVTKDGKTLVAGINGLTSVTIPNGVKNIGDCAFYGCGGLDSVTMPNSVTTIGRYAFKLSRLTSVTIPDGVTNIGGEAFSCCGGLTNVMMLGGCPKAPNDIFQSCRKLKSIHVPANVKSWSRMKKWHGIPLVFDGEQADAAAQRRSGQGANAAVQLQQATVDGYTWSYRVNDGAATIVAEKGGRFSCAVSPMPTGDVKIPTTLDGVKVTSIGREAFRNCKGLTSVTIPEGVTHINESVFCDCSGLKSVTIPSSVTNIAENAFRDGGLMIFRRHDNGRKSFFVASDNPSYSSRNGMLCTKDGSILIVGVNGDVVIPEDVTSIESFAFSGCSGLTSVTIPNSVTNIGNWAFSDCRGLTSVAIPNSVTSIAWSAFSGCSGLTSVTIPNSVTNIGYRAFHGCRGLTSVAIPSSVTGIVGGAFSDCNGITSFSVDASNASYSSRNGMLCTKDGATLVAGVSGVNGNVTIPEGVVSIGAYAFSGCSGLKSVTIPNGVTNIGNWAFSDCRVLTSVAIPEGVTSIGADAFFDCRGLTSVMLPDSVTNIGVGAFGKCSALKSVTISSRVTGIDIGAFFGTPFYDNQPDGMVVLGGGVLYAYKGECPSSVTIPSSVTRIEKHAFAGCRGLKSVTIPSSVTNIAENAFGDRSRLLSRGKSNESNGRKSFSVASDNPSYSSRNGMLCTKDGSILIVGVNGDVVIPECVTSIGNGAFKGCTSLNNVTIPNSVTTIGGAAFFGCSGLKSVTIPNGVTNIGSRAFHGCRELMSVAIPEGVTSIGADVFAGTPFYDNMSDGMVVLGGGVLCGYKGKCPSTVVIPSNVTSVAKGAFLEGPGFLRRRGLRLKMVEISSSVTNIGDCVFSYCGELTSVTMRGERPNAPNNIFERCGKLKAIHVPANAKSWAGMKEWQGIPLVFDVK